MPSFKNDETIYFMKHTFARNVVKYTAAEPQGITQRWPSALAAGTTPRRLINVSNFATALASLSRRFFF